MFLYSTAFYLWSSFVLVRFDGDDDSPKTPSLEDAPSRGGVGVNTFNEDEEEDVAPLFIPLTWSSLQEGELYQRSGPEWQRFLEISKDPKKLHELRHELAKIVMENAGTKMLPVLGSPLSLTATWLIDQFPSRAPPTYVRSGLEFTEDSVHWITKPIEPDVSDRLKVLMNPVHVALAIKDAYLLLLRRQWARFKNPQDESVDMLEMLDEEHAMSRNENLTPLSSHERRTAQSSGSDALSKKASAKDSDLHPSFFLSSLQQLPLPDLGPGSDLHLASIAFKRSLNKYQSRSPRTPRRGTFFISGPVGIQGPRGTCRFEVRGEYDPAKPGWHTIEVSLMDVTSWGNKPRARGNSDE